MSDAVYKIDVKANRQSLKYSSSIQIKRIVWTFIKVFYKYSPRPFFFWRNFLLRLLGAKIGKDVHIYASAVIYFPWNLSIGDYSSIGENALIYNLGTITIGRNVTISQRAHLCAGTHDYTNSSMPLQKLPIIIDDQVWICADAFIGPNVTISEGSVIAARAVVVKNVPPWTVVGGNPAKIIKKRVLQK